MLFYLFFVFFNWKRKTRFPGFKLTIISQVWMSQLFGIDIEVSWNEDTLLLAPAEKTSPAKS